MSVKLSNVFFGGHDANGILTANLGIIEDGLLLERLLDLARKERKVSVASLDLDHRQCNTNLFGHSNDEETAVLVLQANGRGKKRRQVDSGQGFVYCLVTKALHPDHHIVYLHL